MKLSRVAAVAIIFCVAAGLSGCSGGKGSSTSYHGYGYRYGPDPWYYHRGYVRDRVHVVSEEDIRTLEALDSLELPPSPDPGFDPGFGDIDIGGGAFDF